MIVSFITYVSLTYVTTGLIIEFFVGPYILLNLFLWNITEFYLIVSFITYVSLAYVTTGLITEFFVGPYILLIIFLCFLIASFITRVSLACVTKYLVIVVYSFNLSVLDKSLFVNNYLSQTTLYFLMQFSHLSLLR